jgi:dTDP-4-dehydrorhamnose 3,5-epimerase
MIETLPTRLSGLVLVQPQVARDARGFFLETYREEEYRSIGIDARFVQDNHSRSAHGVLRGMHFQADPGQPKLVRVARGRVFDVVIDVRTESPTYGEYEAFELDDDLHRQLFIPPGFAHGFCVLSAEADVAYRVASYYDPKLERGTAWDDPEVGIDWPIANPIVSDRDRANPMLRELRSEG